MEGWSGDYDLLKTVDVNTVYPAIVWFWVLIKEVKWTSVLLDHGTNSNKAFLVPDSHRKTERNGNSINADVTDITIENN